MRANKRKKIPDYVVRQVLIEAGYRCGVPTCRNILAIDLHHLVRVSDGGKDESANLLALSPNCHALHYRGTIPQEAFYAWKQVLVSLSAAFDQEAIDLMLFLYKIKDEPRFLIKADAVVNFARLIGNDLATLEWQEDTVNNVRHIGYRLSLSDKGMRLIEAWKSGNRNAVADALSPRSEP